jgi:hypothetical protein
MSRRRVLILTGLAVMLWPDLYGTGANPFANTRAKVSS